MYDAFLKATCEWMGVSARLYQIDEESHQFFDINSKTWIKNFDD